MRGKVCRLGCISELTGITPAYAGKRQQGNPNTSTYEDHPRVCGEKGNGDVALNGQRGSPPRMRGKD